MRDGSGQERFGPPPSAHRRTLLAGAAVMAVLTATAAGGCTAVSWRWMLSAT